MASSQPTEVQLANLQVPLCSIAERAGFTLVSPFADRHGVAQVRFGRRRGEVLESVSFACELFEPGNLWRFELAAAATFQGRARSGVASVAVLPRNEITKRRLRLLFHEAQRAAAQIAASLVPSAATHFPSAAEATPVFGGEPALTVGA